MNNKKILLNSKKSKTSSDKENFLSIELTNNSRLLPIDNIDEKIDEYKQYLKEKEKSHKYRLSFTINPICTNILFNNISEIVYKEGSDNCKYFGLNGTTISGLTDVKEYLTYKGLSETTSLNRIHLIRDTGFSHSDIGSFVYHCGYDIFNNHTLRKKEFSVINKLGDSLVDDKKKRFNTISDFKRDFDGNIIQERIATGYTVKNSITIPKWGYKDLHQYQVDTLYSFSDSITENLVEENGWVGFLNKTTLDIPNYGNISLNKTMNNNKSGEFIDMYPDRSLYSFVPKVNKYRNNRLEPNWDYCLTYPCEKFYNNSLVQYNDETNNIHVNGLKCEIVGLSVSDNIYELEDGDLIILKTKIKNSFKKGSALQFEVIGEKEKNVVVEKVNILVSVNNIIGKQDDGYYFEIYGGDLIEVLNHYDDPSSAEIRVRQVINGTECEYYFRNFKKIPNYKNGSTIFNSSLNKLAYSKNIYNDDIVQLLYNDDIEIGDLRDNLGRELSEIYLTIIKNNKGYKTWYDEKKYTNSGVTFSHCFGNVTSGVNILDVNEYDYNIHKIHNVPTGVTNSVEIEKYYKKVGIDSDEEKENLRKELNLFENIFKYDGNDYSNPLSLEKEISIENETFLGDIVEFSPSLVEETILENVYHRFNTVQREYYKNGDNEFFNLFTDEIKYDDFDIDNNAGFTLFDSGSSKYNAVYLNVENKKEELVSAPVNISPEGYFYQAHYRIPLKEKQSKVNQGSHTRMTIVDYSEINGKTNEHYIRTNKNYYLEKGGTLYLYDVNTNEKNEATIISVGGKPFTEAIIKFDREIDDNGKLKYRFFKPNVEQPKNSYELTDGSGRYLWREYLNDNEYDKNSPISKYVFTNGAHYINKSINFFLRRQDPDGRYNLSNIRRGIAFIQNLVIDGYSTDNSNIEYNDSEIDGILC